jgi:hypothetical protein
MTTGGSVGHAFHIPYADVNERYLYWTKYIVDVDPQYVLYRTDLQTGTQISRNPLTSGYAGMEPTPWAIDSSPLNPNFLVLSGATPGGSSLSVGQFWSQDGGATWLTRINIAASNRPSAVRYGGDTLGTYFVFGQDNTGALVTTNAGVVLISHLGNLSAGLNRYAAIIGGRSS